MQHGRALACAVQRRSLRIADKSRIVATSNALAARIATALQRSGIQFVRLAKPQILVSPRRLMGDELYEARTRGF